MESEVLKNPLDEFPAEVRRDVEGMIWLGHLDHGCGLGGHTFVLRTLRGDEELLASLVAKEYMETIGQARALQWGQVALALVSVDGDEDFCPPIGPDKLEYARARFRFVTQWYYPVCQFLYGQYTALLQRQIDAIQAVSDLSDRGLTTFTPFADSSTDKGDSVPEEKEDIRDLLEEDSTESNTDS